MTHFLRVTEPLDKDSERVVEGFIKLRLGHSNNGTIIIPDFIFIKEDRKVRYFSPSFFSPCLIRFNVEEGVHEALINVDFASPHQVTGTRTQISIQSIDRLFSYECGAQLYKCTIQCDDKISNFSAGDAIIEGEYFSIVLYHHTTSDALSSILRSNELWSSEWNLQGTRRLQNIAYTYFTSLSKIKSTTDLERIAMSSVGQIALCSTNHDRSEIKTNINVYRENTEGRTARLKVKVPVKLIAPPHLRLHIPRLPDTTYYEVVQPEVFRVGLKPNAKLFIKKIFYKKYIAILDKELMAGFDNVIVGDASTIDGLEAPYDEENTMHLMHLERLEEDDDLFDFWWNHQNSDQVSNRTPQQREFVSIE